MVSERSDFIGKNNKNRADSANDKSEKESGRLCPHLDGIGAHEPFLSAQISYYSSLIQKNPDWEYAGVFADDGISGTGIAKRNEFQRMIKAAENGEIDIILTKSIQRFARNTVDLLETVRHLKDIGVEVRFEKEHINSMSGDGELMLTILASFAQEESRSISDNVKWGTRKRFEQGIPNGRFQIYGYRWEGDKLVVQPEEAKS